jgi:hypothetical protein
MKNIYYQDLQTTEFIDNVFDMPYKNTKYYIIVINESMWIEIFSAFKNNIPYIPNIVKKNVQENDFVLIYVNGKIKQFIGIFQVGVHSDDALFIKYCNIKYFREKDLISSSIRIKKLQMFEKYVCAKIIFSHANINYTLIENQFKMLPRCNNYDKLMRYLFNGDYYFEHKKFTNIKVCIKYAKEASIFDQKIVFMRYLSAIGKMFDKNIIFSSKIYDDVDYKDFLFDYLKRYGGFGKETIVEDNKKKVIEDNSDDNYSDIDIDSDDDNNNDDDDDILDKIELEDLEECTQGGIIPIFIEICKYVNIKMSSSEFINHLLYCTICQVCNNNSFNIIGFLIKSDIKYRTITKGTEYDYEYGVAHYHNDISFPITSDHICEKKALSNDACVYFINKKGIAYDGCIMIIGKKIE